MNIVQGTGMTAGALDRNFHEHKIPLEGWSGQMLLTLDDASISTMGSRLRSTVCGPLKRPDTRWGSSGPPPIAP
eukprot:9194768-Pyramimonas_sp.AAC.1